MIYTNKPLANCVFVLTKVLRKFKICHVSCGLTYFEFLEIVKEFCDIT